ncbi:MAG: type III-B CRISPR module RAMP protein Cmr6 [Betaproteobacteria bacterium]|nr:type III-B CRISPR module RAMP protein Cmr6 [Betaproteobacteria bacterium]
MTMPQAAVIKSVADVANGFRDAAPGHRFNLYCPIWTEDWQVAKTAKTQAVRDSTAIPPEVINTLGALRARQQTLIGAYPDALTVPAISTAPFATGLGNEHPVENGFSFLTPYGLPYLAGSSVKGVLRRAAEELALFPEEYDLPENEGLAMLDVWWLFGFEGAAGGWWPLTCREEHELSDEKKGRRARFKRTFDAHLQGLADRPDLPEFICKVMPPGEERVAFLSNSLAFLRELGGRRQNIRTRGALEFWDVFPQPPASGPNKNALVVEIMTPHFSKYYQDDQTPHDAGQPNPIPFLAVPAGSSFDFHVVCQRAFLPQHLRREWKPMLEYIFRHAFDWLGFGAKTAVGYGAMSRSTRAADPSGVPTGSEQTRVLAARARTITWENAKLTWNPGSLELKAVGSDGTTAPVKGRDAARSLFTAPEMFDRLLGKTELKTQRVEVEIEGNRITLRKVLSS